MILNAKELIELADDMDKNCIDFAKWCLKNIKKGNQKKYFYKKHNKVVADEFTMKEMLEDFKIYKIEEFNKFCKQ